MSHFLLLLSPKFLGFANSLSRSGRRSKRRTWLMVIMGLVFWGAMFAVSSRVLAYFRSVEVIGDLLAHHLLGMILLTLFSLLIFSHVITALSNLYLSKDLELCHSTPASLEEVFLSRAALTVIDSSWMPIVFGLPVLMAYAYVYRPEPAYYFSLFHMGIALTLIAGCLGILFTMIMVRLFPARKTKDILMLLILLLLVGLYLMFRLLRPERLVDPDAFFSVMQYMSALKGPESPMLPTHWMSETLWHYLGGTGEGGSLFAGTLLWSTASTLVVVSIWVAQRLYFLGYSKSQEGGNRTSRRDRFLNACGKGLRKTFGQDLGAILDKDLRTFFRDNTQWSQLLLLGALIAVYLYNFGALPLDNSPIRLEFLQNVIAFLNMGLAGFVLSAISVRFIFPAVSSEGEAFWVIKSSPLSLKRLLWGKYAFYVLPMLVLGEVLIIVTNYLLEVTPFMMILSSVTMFIAVFGIVSLGIGFGALYPNFRYHNIAQVGTSFGGLVYMIFSTLFMAIIVLLEAGPVYLLFKAEVAGKALTWGQWVFILTSFTMVFIVACVSVLRPLKVGLKALSEYE